MHIPLRALRNSNTSSTIKNPTQVTTKKNKQNKIYKKGNKNIYENEKFNFLFF